MASDGSTRPLAWLVGQSFVELVFAGSRLSQLQQNDNEGKKRMRGDGLPDLI